MNDNYFFAYDIITINIRALMTKHMQGKIRIMFINALIDNKRWF